MTTNRLNVKASNDILSFINKAKTGMQDITKMVLIEAGDRLVDRSPVGDPPSWKKQPAHPPPNYRPGRFKNNWQLGVNSFPTDVYMTSDSSISNG
jgi:hypothetical protein